MYCTHKGKCPNIFYKQAGHYWKLVKVKGGEVGFKSIEKEEDIAKTQANMDKAHQLDAKQREEELKHDKKAQEALEEQAKELRKQEQMRLQAETDKAKQHARFQAAALAEVLAPMLMMQRSEVNQTHLKNLDYVFRDSILFSAPRSAIRFPKFDFIFGPKLKQVSVLRFSLFRSTLKQKIHVSIFCFCLPFRSSRRPAVPPFRPSRRPAFPSVPPFRRSVRPVVPPTTLSASLPAPTRHPHAQNKNA